eukprot:CAMPEP_0179207244 /NCGR_PEP_ID=MMETSP0796-20121207/103340_1 /TAXON_ID=73915 /ORGANISM="Pyrodinium bahamense, Strain pbaha01" /LENGTH=38 /DNA_ID= /DNA_START= /DNA_END= /DNA_ORIENTATION=
MTRTLCPAAAPDGTTARCSTPSASLKVNSSPACLPSGT